MHPVLSLLPLALSITGARCQDHSSAAPTPRLTSEVKCANELSEWAIAKGSKIVDCRGGRCYSRVELPDNLRHTPSLYQFGCDRTPAGEVGQCATAERLAQTKNGGTAYTVRAERRVNRDWLVHKVNVMCTVVEMDGGKKVWMCCGGRNQNMSLNGPWYPSIVFGYSAHVDESFAYAIDSKVLAAKQLYHTDKTRFILDAVAINATFDPSTYKNPSETDPADSNSTNIVHILLYAFLTIVVIFLCVSAVVSVAALVADRCVARRKMRLGRRSAAASHHSSTASHGHPSAVRRSSSVRTHVSTHSAVDDSLTLVPTPDTGLGVPPGRLGQGCPSCRGWQCYYWKGSWEDDHDWLEGDYLSPNDALQRSSGSMGTKPPPKPERFRLSSVDRKYSRSRSTTVNQPEEPVKTKQRRPSSIKGTPNSKSKDSVNSGPSPAKSTSMNHSSNRHKGLVSMH